MLPEISSLFFTRNGSIDDPFQQYGLMVIHRASNTPSHDRQRVYCVKAGHKLCQSLAGQCNFACFPAQLHDMGGVDPCDLQEEFASSWLYCGIHRLPKSHLFSILCPTTTVWRALWHNQFPAGAQRYNNNNPNLTPHRTQNTWRAWGVNYPHARGAREGPKPLFDCLLTVDPALPGIDQASSQRPG